ncbi:DUF368 domain-containing protein [Aquimarina sp. MMG016]|uniref:DUF368 domain-containing protein n=1 Tax=Aquimarina sp. MMG016 TaxID=2822690 RepID=UPI001B39F62E|nr:DUF368 domain-containing protein [Aquimarina sp. MMG016]MBQ4820222.1 DUF368 domain-containing protein [Aquimarina sp. MMG016]
MQRSLKDYLIISAKGLAMGAADVVPGVSGGTIAFISGIYEELITTISNIDLSLLKVLKNEGILPFWKKLNGSFLLALLLGIVFSIFTVMNLSHYLLEHHPVLIWSFFFGLVLASILFVGKQIKRWRGITIIALTGSAILAYYLTTLPPLSDNTGYLFLFFSGALAICAMILPGISGAFILVLLGAYGTISEAVHNFDIKKIATVGLGAIIGILSFSRILKWLFKNYENTTLALLTGFILGSLNKIWPWKNILETKQFGDKIVTVSEESIFPNQFEGDPQTLIAIGLMVLGFMTILILERLAVKKES